MRRDACLISLVLGLAACGDDGPADEPTCAAAERLVDVHFNYDTESQIETESCELTQFGHWNGDTSSMVVDNCGYRLDLAGVTPPEMNLEIGDAIEIETSVDDNLTHSLGCAENGWLSIADAQGRTQFAALSVATIAEPLSFGDLGEIEFEDASIDGCQVLRLRAGGDEATVPEGTSTEIELDGVRLLVQLGFFADDQGSCGNERYSVVLFRL